MALMRAVAVKAMIWNLIYIFIARARVKQELRALDPFLSHPAHSEVKSTCVHYYLYALIHMCSITYVHY